MTMDLQSCVTIEKEWDIVKARQLGREVAQEAGFGTVDQARIATAISELARNIICIPTVGNYALKSLIMLSKKVLACYRLMMAQE